MEKYFRRPSVENGNTPSISDTSKKYVPMKLMTKADFVWGFFAFALVCCIIAVALTQKCNGKYRISLWRNKVDKSKPDPSYVGMYYGVHRQETVLMEITSEGHVVELDPSDGPTPKKLPSMVWTSPFSGTGETIENRYPLRLELSETYGVRELKITNERDNIEITLRKSLYACLKNDDVSCSV